MEQKIKKASYSFEVFPPKKDGDFNSAFNVTEALSRLSPDFISVTYGAGGSRSKSTLEIASYIQNNLNVTAMAHMTCVGSKHGSILDFGRQLEDKNIGQVLALRGDRPSYMTDEQYNGREFTYASDLIRFLKKHTNLDIYAACYPEKHFEAKSLDEDIVHMREKQNLGVSHFITQMFFDNSCFYKFLEKSVSAGITAPIHTGIMPITSINQIGTSIALSGSKIPKRLADIIAVNSDSNNDMYKAGIEYAIEQIEDLIENGVKNIHIYTMNKPIIAREIVSAIDW